MNTSGTLYVVATPIGNLEDMTLRALRILKEVDLILCEDTRVTRNLLNHYGIVNKTESYHAQSSMTKIDTTLEKLLAGTNIALVSDAGTPTLSDPGYLLIHEIKNRAPEVPVVPVPGASALLASLCASGAHAAQFTFLGFLPHKKGRETLFTEIAKAERTMVFYESPHRIIKTLEALRTHLQDTKKVIIGRELTKMFEEIVSGSVEELLHYFTEKKDHLRGEFVVIVEAR